MEESGSLGFLRANRKETEKTEQNLPLTRRWFASFEVLVNLA